MLQKVVVSNEDFELPLIFDDINFDRDSNDVNVSIEPKQCENRSEASLSVPTNELYDRRDAHEKSSAELCIEELFKIASHLPDELIPSDDLNEYLQIFNDNNGEQNVQSIESEQNECNHSSPESPLIANDNELPVQTLHTDAIIDTNINAHISPLIQNEVEIPLETDDSVESNIAEHVIPIPSTSSNTTSRPKRRAGRYSLKDLGYTEEQRRERTREQNKRSQQKKRDKAKAEKRKRIANERKAQNVNSTNNNCVVVLQSVVIEPQNVENGQTLYAFSGPKLHLLVNALDESLRAPTDEQKNDLILFVNDNIKSVLIK